MAQVKDYPNRNNIKADDFLYLITNGNSDYKVLLSDIVGHNIKKLSQQTYTLVLEDSFKYVRSEFAGGTIFIVPNKLTTEFAIGTVIYLRNKSNNNATIQAENSDVLLNTNSNLQIKPHGEVKLLYVDDNEWDLTGDLI